jgi:L-threonylcarbamoyladenylate synthase
MPAVNLDRLTAALQGGDVGSFPTDTLPALACLPASSAKIYQVKARSQTKPLILMAATVADLWQYASGSTAELLAWQQVAARYLPGALTLVLPANPDIPAAVDPTASGTIGLRVPDCDIARSILSVTGALATTSANKSGQPALLTMADIARDFPQVYTLDRESETPPLATPSTVIKWHPHGWEILRQGAIDFS